MKLETLKQKVDIIRGDDVGDRTYGIDAKNMHLAIQAFYQYSNPIGSIIREITSNGFDAHIEAGVTDKPVMVTFDETEQAVRVTDFGVGLSPERVNDIFTKFFSSTKRETNDQIGAFGLGSKSPLSYTDMFQVRTKYGSTVYDYVIHKSDGVPSLVEVSKDTWADVDNPWQSNENGTSVIIPVKSGDMGTFIREAKTQLAYFDNVFLNGKDCDDYNKEKIYRGSNYIYRASQGYATHALSNIHICVGKVYYPLSNLASTVRNSDFDELKRAIEEAWQSTVAMNPNADRAQVLYKLLNDKKNPGSYDSANRQAAERFVKLPMALYFDIGELPILWHRENIEYTKEATHKVLTRYYQALFELKIRQATDIGDVTSLKQALLARNVTGNDTKGNIHFHKDALKATYSEVVLTDLEAALSQENSYIGNAEPRTFTHFLWKQHKDSKGISLDELIDVLYSEAPDPKIYRIEEGEARKANLTDYMAHKGYKYLIMPKRKLSELQETMGLKEHKAKTIATRYAKEFFEAFDKLPQANDIEIPSSFRRVSTAQKVREIPILLKRVTQASMNSTYTRHDLKDIMGRKRSAYDYAPSSLLIYGFQADRDLLDKYSVYNRSSMYREKFGGKPAYFELRAYMGVISKETATFIHEVCPSVYIKDFFYHRRAIANLATIHMLYLYEKKYPWFAEMLKSTTSDQWRALKAQGFITEQERLRLHGITLSGREYTKEHFMYPYVMHALKNRYIHFDELEAYKWAHGMLAKFAPLLQSDWIHSDLEKRANNYYFAKECEAVQQNINPILYRKYHVKNIES